MANSKPMWCVETSSLFNERRRQKNKKIVPIKTCNPWKPVETKKFVPNTLSLTEKVLFMYSKSWKPVKTTPNDSVINIEVEILFLICTLWCAQVTLTPEDNKIAVFSKGTLKGSRGETRRGGHVNPTSWTGQSLLWKKDQNQAIKNKTSLKINNSIPHFNPSWTFSVWSPKIAASRDTSRHQRKENSVSKNTLVRRKRL